MLIKLFNLRSEPTSWSFRPQNFFVDLSRELKYTLKRKLNCAEQIRECVDSDDWPTCPKRPEQSPPFCTIQLLFGLLSDTFIMREINPNICKALSNIQNSGAFYFTSCYVESGLFINQILSKEVSTTWSFGWDVIEAWKDASVEDIEKVIDNALDTERYKFLKYPERFKPGVNELLSQPQFLKTYILIKDTIPVGHAVNCAAHASLGMYLDFQKDPLVQRWVEGSFRKVSCKVTEEQFEKAKTYGDYKAISESNLGENVEVALAFIPRWEWPRFFNTLPLYK